jgi:hypothetical protein
MTITWDELAAFYDAGQPRDGRGRWTDMGRATASYKGRHDTARRMVAAASTREHAEAAIRTSYGVDPEDNLASLQSLYLGGLTDAQGIKLAGQLVKLNEKYPGVVLHTIESTDQMPSNVGAQVISPKILSGPGPVILQINTSNYHEGFGTENPDFINGSGTEYAVTHEYGHLLHLNVVGDYTLKPRPDTRGSRRLREAEKWVTDYEKSIGRKLGLNDMSPYSYVGGDSELVAESFADVEINGGAARPLSKYLHHRLTTAYRDSVMGQQSLFVSRETDAELIDMFYSPTQPRGGDGKWTKGAGSSGGGSARAAGFRVRPGEQELDAITKHMRPQLTDAEMNAIEYLKIDAGADAVNYYHREMVGTPLEQKYANEPSMVKAKAASEALDQVFADLPPIQEELTLYRGFRDAGEGYLPKNLVGQELVDDGYMFVTADRDVAKYYAEQTDGKTLIMKMKAPPGTKVLPFWALHESHVDDVTGEYTSKEAYAEMLLPRGTKMTVDNVFSMGGGVQANARIN